MKPILNAPPTQDFLPHCPLSREGSGQGEGSALPAVAADDPRVLAALEEYLAAVEAGRLLDRQEFLLRHSAIEPALRKAIGGLDFINEIGCYLSEAGSTVEAPAPASELAGGQPLGDFRILRQIGRGGMGVVYEAEQLSLGRRVALKVLPFAAALDAKQLQRFKNEAQAAGQLVHQHIVPVYGVGCERGVHYYAMQLIEGHSLARMIADLRLQIADLPNTTSASTKSSKEEIGNSQSAICNLQSEICTSTVAAISTERPATRPAFFRTIASLGVQAAEALEHAHQMGVIHRDVKPGNLLIDQRGNLWITDFGLAHFQSDHRLTLTGDILGTLRYMSPEAALAKRVVVDHRTDIYSLGATLYELLTLEPVFGGEDRQELLRQIAFEEPTPPRRVNKAIPAELETIVLKAMEKNPAERYGTAQELADDLERFLKDEPIRAKRPTLLQRGRKWARRHRPVVSMAAVSLGVLLAMTLVGLAISNAQIKKEQQETQNALGREKQVNDDLVKSIEREARTKYCQNVQLADRELAAENSGRAEELLDECPVNFRGWEWHYLKRRRYQEPVTFRGHKDWICGVALSPDGTRAVSGSAISLIIGDLKVWDTVSGKTIRTLLGHIGPIAGVAYSADGKTVASACWDRTVRLWDTTTWETRHTLEGHTDYVSCVALSPDNRLVASGSGDHTVKLWDAQTGQEIRTLRGHSRGITSVAFSPDSRSLATGSHHEVVRIFDVATGKEVHALRGHAGTILGLAYSRDGQRLASASFDGSVRIWEATTGRQVRTIRADILFAMSVAFNRHGTRLAVGSWDKTVKLWDPETGQEVLTLRGHDDMVYGVAFSEDGRLLASSSLDGTVKVWDATSSEGVKSGETLLRGQGDALLSLLYTPDGRHLALAGFDGTVKLLDPLTGKVVKLLGGEDGPVISLGFSRDGQRLASATMRGIVKVWNVAAGKEIAALGGNLGGAAISPDGQRVAWSRDGGFVEIHDIESGRLLHEFHTHPAPVIWTGYSPDGKRIATTSWDKTAKIWDAAGKAELFALKGHTHVIQFVVYSPDGQRLATASWDRTAKVWDAATGKEIFTLRGHKERVGAVTFSPDGKYLATVSADNTVKVWDGTTGAELHTLRGHAGYVGNIAFSPDSKRLATASGYRGRWEIRILDATHWDGKREGK